MQAMHEQALPLTPQNNVLLDELVTVADFSADLTLLFARCNVPAIRSQLIELATQRLLARGVQVQTVEIDGTVTQLRQFLRSQLDIASDGEPTPANETALNKNEWRKVLFVVGLEHSLPYGQADAQALTELNMGRELFHRDVPLPILFWLPDFALTMVARGAPDFWAWRSGVFEFETDPAQRQDAVERLTQHDADWLNVGNLSDAQKRSRRTVLENLLDDYDALEQDERTLAQRSELLYSLAQVNFSIGEFQQAQVYLEGYLDLSRRLANRSDEGTALGFLGRVHHARGDYDTALQFLQQSLAIRQEIGDKSGEGTTLNNISQIHRARGDYDTALQFLQQSLAIQKEIGDKSGEGTTLNNISQIHRARGDYDTALQFLQQSLAIQKEIGDKSGEGTTLNNISQIHRARGDYDTALQFLQQSLAIQKEIGDKSGEGTTLNNISQIHRARGDYDTALQFLQQSLAIQKEIGDKSGEGTTLNNISQIYDSRGDYDTALQFLQQSLAIQKEIGDVSGLCATLFNMGHIYLQNKEQQEALGAWVTVYRLASQMNLAQALDALAGLADQLGLEGGLDGWAALAAQAEDEGDDE